MPFWRPGLPTGPARQRSHRVVGVTCAAPGGWILDRFTDLDVSGFSGLAIAPARTKLDPHGGRQGSIDTGWSGIVNTTVEPDA